MNAIVITESHISTFIYYSIYNTLNNKHFQWILTSTSIILPVISKVIFPLYWVNDCATELISCFNIYLSFLSCSVNLFLGISLSEMWTSFTVPWNATLWCFPENLEKTQKKLVIWGWIISSKLRYLYINVTYADVK